MIILIIFLFWLPKSAIIVSIKYRYINKIHINFAFKYLLTIIAKLIETITLIWDFLHVIS